MIGLLHDINKKYSILNSITYMMKRIIESSNQLFDNFKGIGSILFRKKWLEKNLQKKL
jgi:hypothetical protein